MRVSYKNNFRRVESDAKIVLGNPPYLVLSDGGIVRYKEWVDWDYRIVSCEQNECRMMKIFLDGLKNYHQI